MAASQFAS